MSDTESGRGGYRRPASPAPVSGPGALSQRTDGGPGAQPVRVAPGATQYGGQQELAAGQQVQPLPQASPLSSPGAGSPPAPEAGGSLGGVFSQPTTAPGEPVTAGAATGPGPAPAPYFRDDPDEVLSIMLEMTGDPDLRSLLEGRSAG